jgi:hypothetical protein
MSGAGRHEAQGRDEGGDRQPQVAHEMPQMFEPHRLSPGADEACSLGCLRERPMTIS